MVHVDLRPWLAELCGMRDSGDHADGRRVGRLLASRLDRIIAAARETVRLPLNGGGAP